MQTRLSSLLVLGLAVGATVGPACGGSTPNREGAAKVLRIAVIPKGTTHEFWKAIHAGAVKASRDHGVTVIWKGPVREDDRDEQIKVVETFVSQQVDGIVLAPLDSKALVPVLNDARARKIPVAIIDSGVEWDGAVTFVATDNEKAGGLAAERLGTVLGGKGRVIMMRLQEGSASTTARESGFLATLAAKFPGITVVSSNQYGGATTETGFAMAERLLAGYKDVDGIFCPNETTTFGMLLALEAAGRAGKVRFVGFDASPKLVEALEQGKLDGLVLQDPFRMGDLGVSMLLSALKGQPIERRVDTGATMVTRENMKRPEIRLLLAPELAKYLN
jgi:ribose transport system substrate-binding protein